MSVGVQRKPCRKMPQHARYGFDVHAVLQCQRCEGMSEVVKAYVRQSCVFQNFLTPFVASIAAASFALHSACVLPRTFLMMRFIVSTSAPHLSCCRGRKCMISYSREEFPKVKDTTLKPTLTLLPNKTIWEANPMKKLIPANITSITAVWN